MNNDKTSALAVMADRMNLEPQKLHQTLKSTVFKGATDEEMMTLVVVANEHRLNPLQKEIYAFPSKGGGIAPVISIDGWIKIMNQHPKMGGGPRFQYELDENKGPFSCICSINIKGRTEPVVISEFFSECKRNSEPWRQYPFRMLRHKTLAQTIRVAFGFAGYGDSAHEDEMTDEQPSDLKPIFAEDEPPPAVELFSNDAPEGAEVKTKEELVLEKVED